MRNTKILSFSDAQLFFIRILFICHIPQPCLPIWHTCGVHNMTDPPPSSSNPRHRVIHTIKVMHITYKDRVQLHFPNPITVISPSDRLPSPPKPSLSFSLLLLPRIKRSQVCVILSVSWVRDTCPIRPDIPTGCCTGSVTSGHLTAVTAETTKSSERSKSSSESHSGIILCGDHRSDFGRQLLAKKKKRCATRSSRDAHKMRNTKIFSFSRCAHIYSGHSQKWGVILYPHFFWPFNNETVCSGRFRQPCRLHWHNFNIILGGYER